MFAFRAGTVLEELAEHAPEVYAGLPATPPSSGVSTGTCMKCAKMTCAHSSIHAKVARSATASMPGPTCAAIKVSPRLEIRHPASSARFASLISATSAFIDSACFVRSHIVDAALTEA